MSYSFGNNKIQIGKFSSAYVNSIAIGKSAITDNISGIAIGNEAKAHGNGTWGSICIGYQTGKSNTVGYMIAIGIGALASYNIAAHAVGIGYNALTLCNESGNIGIGYSVLSALTTGRYNNALGHFAAYKTYNSTTTTGYGNCVIGRYALSENTVGRYNVCIGHQAGNAITDGIYNICIGRLANSTDRKFRKIPNYEFLSKDKVIFFI